VGGFVPGAAIAKQTKANLTGSRPYPEIFKPL